MSGWAASGSEPLTRQVNILEDGPCLGPKCLRVDAVAAVG